MTEDTGAYVDLPPDVSTSETMAARWRKDICAELMKMTGLLATGSALVGAPVIGERVSEMTDPYAFVLAVAGADGVIVQVHGLRFRHDADRVRRAIADTFDPESALHMREWEAEQQAKLERYEVEHSFMCGRGHCRDRFATARGLAAHERHAARRAAVGQDWVHQPSPEPPPATQKRPALALAVETGA
jgi:hypothetical protein